MSEPTVNGSGVVDIVEALRRAAARPRTAAGWVHAGPGLLDEAADRIERLEAAAPQDRPASQGEEREPEGEVDLLATWLAKEAGWSSLDEVAKHDARFPDADSLLDSFRGDARNALAFIGHGSAPKCEACGKEVGEDRGPYPPDGIYLCGGCELPVTEADSTQKGQS